MSFFFFQAEDGIRDWSVTGVQTCALPIWVHPNCDSGNDRPRCGVNYGNVIGILIRDVRESSVGSKRSEERRVGKECRSGEWRKADTRKRQRDEGAHR